MRTALLLSGSVLLLAQGQPTFYAAYEDGLEHEKAGHWREALAAYQRAIALRPRPAAKVVIYGNNLLLDYYPYARAARCQLELGQPEAARSLLIRSEGAGEPESFRTGLQARLPIPKAPAAPTPPAPAPPTPPSPPTADPEPPALPSGMAVAAEPRSPAQAPASVLPKATETVAKPPAMVPREAAGAATRTPEIPAPSGVPPPVQSLPVWSKALLAGTAALLALWALIRLRRPRPAEAGYRDPVQVGPYRIGRLLGRGGFASTYMAWDPETGDKVAVKVLHPFRQDDPEFVGRFQQEARLGTLLDHPNLVRLLNHGPDRGLQWLVMEFVSGERLDQRLKASGPLPIAEVLRLGREIASAMAHAHALGVVHRDLKPSNVMLADGRAKVMDFGISRRMDAETLTTTYAFLGTPLYAAPEAQLKTQVGPASDRYALGIMLFEMLAGRPPFSGETPFEILDQHRSAALPDLRALRPDTPAALADLVLRLSAKDPADRPEDAELLDLLGRLEGAGP